MENRSGIEPLGRRVLVKPDEIERKTAGGIALPDNHLERHEQAISTGWLVAVGGDAWIHGVEDVYRLMDGEMKLAETRVDRRKSEYPEVGSRVVFAKFQGKDIPGLDGEKYRLLNDEDITALADEAVEFGTFNAREPLSKQA